MPTDPIARWPLVKAAVKAFQQSENALVSGMLSG